MQSQQLARNSSQQLLVIISGPIFSELLESNRKNLIEGKSFIITVIRDKENQENRFRRISVRKIVNLSDIANQEYSNVLNLDTINVYKDEKPKIFGDSKYFKVTNFTNFHCISC